MGSKILRSIYLDLDQIKKIKELSEKTRVPQAVYIREGLDLIIQKYKSLIVMDPQTSLERMNYGGHYGSYSK